MAGQSRTGGFPFRGRWRPERLLWVCLGDGLIGGGPLLVGPELVAPQAIAYRRVLLSWRYSGFLSYQFLSLQLVQKAPGAATFATRFHGPDYSSE
jgi:hypothetical protein